MRISHLFSRISVSQELSKVVFDQTLDFDRKTQERKLAQEKENERRKEKEKYSEKREKVHPFMTQSGLCTPD